jgi:hypothetical protein
MPRLRQINRFVKDIALLSGSPPERLQPHRYQPLVVQLGRLECIGGIIENDVVVLVTKAENASLPSH